MDAKKRKKHLTSARKCRQFLSAITNEMYHGELKPDIRSRLAYVTNIILKAIEVEKLEDIERRLDEIERSGTNGEVQRYPEKVSRN